MMHTRIKTKKNLKMSQIRIPEITIKELKKLKLIKEEPYYSVIHRLIQKELESEKK